MVKLDSRVQALEEAGAGRREIRTYQQDRWGETDLFRRIYPADSEGRLLTREECLEDAGSNATVIWVLYEDREI